VNSNETYSKRKISAKVCPEPLAGGMLAVAGEWWLPSGYGMVRFEAKDVSNQRIGGRGSFFGGEICAGPGGCGHKCDVRALP